MTDIFNKKKRSEIMSNISGKNTKPELLVRKALFTKGYRYRIYRRDLPGNPDIVFPSRKKVIFINGCFWHGHNCKKAILPVTNTSFWKEKINKNILRDNENYILLTKLGWKVLVIWQCEMKKNEIENEMAQVIEFLEN